MKETIVQGEIRNCCKEEINLELQPTDSPDKTVRICKVCGRRHFRMTLGSAKFGGE